MFRRLSIKDLYIQLIVLNLAIFLIANIANSLGSSFFPDWLALNLQHPMPKIWTLITAHFLHIGFGHVFNNMIIILLFGYLAQYFFRPQSVLSIYIVGAIFSSAVILLLIGRLLGVEGVAYGASCVAYAIMMAPVIYKPNFTISLFIFGRVKIKWIALVLFILGVVIDFSANITGTLGHLAGAIFGAWYGWKAREGKNILQWWDNLFEKWGLGQKNTIKSNPINQRRTYNYKSKPKAGKKASKLNMDEILDKISKKGMKSLSKEEKEFLEKS